MRWHREALTEELASEPDVAPSSRQRHYRASLAQAKGIPSTTERPGSQDV